jgi:Nuclease-related domain
MTYVVSVERSPRTSRSPRSTSLTTGASDVDTGAMAIDSATGPRIRRAGQYGREVVRRMSLRAVSAVGLLVASTAFLGLAFGIHSRGFLVVEIVAIALMLVINWKLMPVLDRRIRGVTGEQHVGAILDELAPDGWMTLHDLSTGRGNIDHIVIGPGGVLTIETKSHGGRISPTRLEPRWLAQAYAERKSVEEIAGVQVDCLLVFSRAYLVGKPVSRQRGVLVLPARMLARHLTTRRSVLTPEQVAALHARILGAFTER